MDFVKNRQPRVYLRFSKLSTVFWAVMLVLVAYASREAKFVLNLAARADRRRC